MMGEGWLGTNCFRYVYAFDVASVCEISEYSVALSEDGSFSHGLLCLSRSGGQYVCTSVVQISILLAYPSLSGWSACVSCQDSDGRDANYVYVRFGLKLSCQGRANVWCLCIGMYLD